MAKQTVLLVDNDPDFASTRKDFLEQAGFEVYLAQGSEQAKQVLQEEQIGLAIIDIRLEDDNDDRDTSGLALAREIGASASKIVLTGFPNYDYVTQTLRPREGDAPLAADFVAKAEGPDAMVQAVRQVLRKNGTAMMAMPANGQERLKPFSFDISAQLEKDYEEMRRQAFLLNRWRIAVAVAGTAVLLAGAIAAIFGYTTIGLLNGALGAITEGVGLLFHHYTQETNKRKDLYHKELLGLFKKSSQGHQG